MKGMISIVALSIFVIKQETKSVASVEILKMTMSHELDKSECNQDQKYEHDM